MIYPVDSAIQRLNNWGQEINQLLTQMDSSLEWERKIHRCLFTFSIKCEIKHFHIVVMRGHQRNGQKSVMHVQRCCIANLNLLLFWCSLCVACYHCCGESSLLSLDGLTNGSVLKSMTRTDSILVLFKVWSLESGDCQLTLPGDHSSGVSCVTFNDQWVISGDNCGEIKVNSGVHHK